MQDETNIDTSLTTRTKIIFVVTKGVWGGAQKYVFDLATNLPREQYDVAVLHGEGEVLPEKLKVSGIPTDRIEGLGRDVDFFKDIDTFLTLLRIFRKNKPDIVHLNSSKIGGLGALAGRLTGVKKIVFTVHGFAFNEHRSWFQKKIILFLSWLSIIFSTHVIFISEMEMKQAVKWPGIAKKATLIYNGIQTPEFLPREEAQRELARILNQPPEMWTNVTVIGSIGELTKNKGYEYALPAVQNIPDSIYVIIGTGYDKQQLEITSLTKDAKEKIFFTGFVPNASRFLLAFDIFLLPSLKEGLPYVLLEAGLASCAVVATRVGGIPEIIAHNTNGILVNPKSTGEIGNTLATLIHNPDLRKTLGVNLEQTIQSKFSLETMVQKTAELYRYNTYLNLK